LLEKTLDETVIVVRRQKFAFCIRRIYFHTVVLILARCFRVETRLQKAKVKRPASSSRYVEKKEKICTLLLSAPLVVCALFAHPRRGELFTALNVCRGASDGRSLKGWSVRTTRRERQDSLRIFFILRDRRFALSEEDASRDQEGDGDEDPTLCILTSSRLSLAVAARNVVACDDGRETLDASRCVGVAAPSPN
jgi:hypothetical protein